METLKSLVINLPQRVDRLKEFREEIKWLGLNPLVIDGVIDRPALKGIGTAHTNCIRLAQERDWDKVLIMEDDVVFQGKQKTIPYFNECLNNLPSDWDILLGGAYNKLKLIPHNKHWEQVVNFCGLHFYIVNSSCYEKLLTYNGSEHFDKWLCKQNLRIFVTSKFIAHQRDGYSDNAGTVTNYNQEHLNQSKLLI
jgi:GR25 family glycosyltransferase involved in LPS biosynthesis